MQVVCIWSICSLCYSQTLSSLASFKSRLVLPFWCQLTQVSQYRHSPVMSMYTGAKTVFRTVYSNSKGFEVKAGMHQGSALSPLLFAIVMEAMTGFRVAITWELLYADDLAVIAETEDKLIKSLNEWKNNLENRGMRVNMNKTKVMISVQRQKVMQKAVRWPCGVCGRGMSECMENNLTT